MVSIENDRVLHLIFNQYTFQNEPFTKVETHEKVVYKIRLLWMNYFNTNCSNDFFEGMTSRKPPLIWKFKATL